MSDAQSQVNLYYQLVQAGTPPAEAFAKAFPDGLPNTAKNQAKEAQKGQYVQLGGLAAGAYGTSKLIDALSGSSATAAKKTVADAVTNTATTTAPTSTGTGSGLLNALWGSSEPAAIPATPEVLGASRVPAAADAALGTGMEGGAAAGQGLTGGVGLGGLAAGAYTGYQQFQGAKNIAEGKKVSPIEQAALYPLTGGLSVLWNKFGAHESTKDAEQRRWGNLQDKGVSNADQLMALSHPEGDTGIWKDGPNAGKAWNFEDAKTTAMQNPLEFAHVLGNYETFGPEWQGYNDDQKSKIVSAVLANDLYDPNKGDILIKDQERARQLRDQALGITPQAQVIPKPLTGLSAGTLGSKLAGALA